jgi:hypothetical protein
VKWGKADTRARVRLFDDGTFAPRVAGGVRQDVVDFMVAVIKRHLDHLHGDGVAKLESNIDRGGRTARHGA